MEIPTEDDFREGDLVYLTTAGHDWMGRNASEFNIPMAGRMARIDKKISWKTKKGKELLKKRLDSGMWDEKAAKDRKFVLVLYIPEVAYDGKDGAAVPELFPLYHPSIKDKKVPLFQPYSHSIMKDMFSKNRFFKLEDKL